MLRPILTIAILTLGLTPAAHADLVEKFLTFTVAPNSSTQVGLERPYPDTESATATRGYSGSFTGTIGFDSDSLEPITFTFGSGAIIGSGFDLQLGAFVTYPSYGSKFTYYFQQGSGISYSPTTYPTPGIVDFDGSLNTIQNKLYASQGAIVTGRSVTGSQLNRITNDYINFPNFINFLGTPRVSIVQVAKNQFSYTLSAQLIITFDESTLISLPVAADPNLNTSIIKTEVGTVTSSSLNFTAPTPYGTWAIANGLVNPSPEATNKSGIPYGILYALNLSKTATTLPISIENTPSGPIVKIILPDDGLLNAMKAEYSPNLATTPWQDLPEANYIHGSYTLDKGLTGAPTFSFPAGDGGFIRFVTTIE